MCECQHKSTDGTLGFAEPIDFGVIPGWESPAYNPSGYQSITPHYYGPGGVVQPAFEDLDDEHWMPTAAAPTTGTPQPATMQQAVNQTPTVAVDDAIRIDQQTLLVAAAVGIGLMIFAAK